jgi:hypothetical protein
MPDVKVPVIGKVPKGAAVAGIGSAVVITGYLIYKHNKAKTATGSATGYGAAGYGYGSGFYGYGFGYGMGSGNVTPYPVGSEYGYGAYGYGMYNPYTGQYIGPYGGSPSPTPTPTPTPTPKPTSGWQTINGRKEYFSAAKNTFGYYVGSGKHRKWVRVPAS